MCLFANAKKKIYRFRRFGLLYRGNKISNDLFSKNYHSKRQITKDEQEFLYYQIKDLEGKTTSKDIAFYSLTHQHKLILSKIPEKDLLELKVLIAERDKVVKAINQFKTTSENQGFMPKEVLQSVLKINKTVISQLQKALEKLEEKMKDLIEANEQLSSQYKLITSIPGVGPQTAIHMIAVTKGLSLLKTGEKWLVMQDCTIRI